MGDGFPEKKKMKKLQGHQRVMFRFLPPMRKWSVETSGRVCCNLVGNSSSSQGKKYLS